MAFIHNGRSERLPIVPIIVDGPVVPGLTPAMSWEATHDRVFDRYHQLPFGRKPVLDLLNDLIQNFNVVK